MSSIGQRDDRRESKSTASRPRFRAGDIDVCRQDDEHHAVDQDARAPRGEPGQPEPAASPVEPREQATKPDPSALRIAIVVRSMAHGRDGPRAIGRLRGPRGSRIGGQPGRRAGFARLFIRLAWRSSSRQAPRGVSPCVVAHYSNATRPPASESPWRARRERRSRPVRTLRNHRDGLVPLVVPFDGSPNPGPRAARRTRSASATTTENEGARGRHAGATAASSRLVRASRPRAGSAKSGVMVGRQAVEEQPGVSRDQGRRGLEVPGLPLDQGPPDVVQLGGRGRRPVEEEGHGPRCRGPRSPRPSRSDWSDDAITNGPAPLAEVEAGSARRT